MTTSILISYFDNREQDIKHLSGDLIRFATCCIGIIFCGGVICGITSNEKEIVTYVYVWSFENAFSRHKGYMKDE